MRFLEPVLTGADTTGAPSRFERTLLLIKPDAVERRLIGPILGRIERAGLTISGLTMQLATEDVARKHYPASERQLRGIGDKLLAATREMEISVADALGTDDAFELGMMIFEGNIRFLTAGPVVAVVVEGYNAVRKTRQLCGATLPCDAAPGSIRGDFGSAGVEQVWMGDMTVRNLVHSSDDQREAEREIALWFPRG